MLTTFLTPEIKEQLLNSPDHILAEMGWQMGGLQVQTIRANLKNNAPRMTLPHVQVIIRDVLNLPSTEEIVEIIDIPTN